MTPGKTGKEGEALSAVVVGIAAVGNIDAFVLSSTPGEIRRGADAVSAEVVAVRAVVRDEGAGVGERAPSKAGDEAGTASAGVMASAAGGDVYARLQERAPALVSRTDALTAIVVAIRAESGHVNAGVGLYTEGVPSLQGEAPSAVISDRTARRYRYATLLEVAPGFVGVRAHTTAAEIEVVRTSGRDDTASIGIGAPGEPGLQG